MKVMSEFDDKRVKDVWMPKEGLGALAARELTIDLYDEQDYFFQVDSHAFPRIGTRL